MVVREFKVWFFVVLLISWTLDCLCDSNKLGSQIERVNRATDWESQSSIHWFHHIHFNHHLIKLRVYTTISLIPPYLSLLSFLHSSCYYYHQNLIKFIFVSGYKVRFHTYRYTTTSLVDHIQASSTIWSSQLRAHNNTTPTFHTQKVLKSENIIL